MSRALHAKRDELIGLAVANGGNTRGDAKFDVDGAIGTLLAYAEIGASLGTSKVLLDGEGIQLGRSPRFHGQHVLTPRRGVAVHINAFNFPAWGFAEKAAVALLAGMPVLSKPATSSAMLAHRIVELIVEAKLLPEGALQLLVGPPRDLIERLGAQDVLAFTGSGDTGEKIRALPNIIRNSVRVNIEADSLNAAVLGPEVEPRSDMYELFLKEVVRDVTQKAGQKCTAIRRIIVPQQVAAEVKSDLAELLAVVKVGDPADEETKMGPLATASQLADARAGVEMLGGKIAFGGTGKVLEKGFFISPTLVEEPGPVAHEREVFGPIASVIAYSENPGEIVARGNGGLVCSIHSEDQAFIEETVAEVAPYHGRIYLGHPKVELSPGPGTVLPQLVHGGPGRAGGGEELGGARGLAFYLQRTALEGARPVIAKITGAKSQ